MDISLTLVKLQNKAGEVETNTILNSQERVFISFKDLSLTFWGTALPERIIKSSIVATLNKKDIPLASGADLKDNFFNYYQNPSYNN